MSESIGCEATISFQSRHEKSHLRIGVVVGVGDAVGVVVGVVES